MPQEDGPIRSTMSDVEGAAKYLDILVALVPSVATALKNQNVSTFWGLLVFTAPLTATVALQTYRVMRDRVQSLWGLVVSTFILLIVLSLVSKWTHIGTALDIGKVEDRREREELRRIMNHEPPNTGRYWLLSYLGDLLDGYFTLYQPVPFWASLGCGVFIGYRVAKRAEAREDAQKQAAKRAAATGA